MTKSLVNKPFARIKMLKVFPDLFDILNLLRVAFKDLLHVNLHVQTKGDYFDIFKYNATLT